MTGPPSRIALAAMAFAVVVICAGCGRSEQPQVTGPAPAAAPEAGPVYVSDALGHPLIRPRRFGIDEFTSLDGLRWTGWGTEKATAAGFVHGPWCREDCPPAGYPATVELSRPEGRENVSYYTRARVSSPRLPPERAAELRDLRLIVPEP
ncbi:hypothetical protein [Streptomyces sp. WAC08241]|uniref:hypothetical protein n=1 Tax=Streptomyces sp. WAC08241 TaxID=2487421 RepID=UPI000F79777A|nr:hypothetical protein [Streptomyces sp. WAC08241]RSS37149.1 hypothetical protein EF906_23735 [Streptomyces sp. WAC08241]